MKYLLETICESNEINNTRRYPMHKLFDFLTDAEREMEITKKWKEAVSATIYEVNPIMTFKRVEEWQQQQIQSTKTDTK